MNNIKVKSPIIIKMMNPQLKIEPEKNFIKILNIKTKKD